MDIISQAPKYQSTKVLQKSGRYTRDIFILKCVYFRFEYLTSDFPKELGIQQTSGIIYPNETVHHDWTIAPDQLGDSNFDIPCRLRTDMSNRSTVVKIDVTGKCAEGSLIVILYKFN